MTRSRVLAGIVTAAFCLTLAASVRADNAHVNIQLEKLIFAETHQIGIENQQGENEQGDDTNYLYTAHFENNNGKHLGFSMALAHNGPKPEIVRSIPEVSSVTPNPEPTAMVLLGTGLAAVGGFARRINRRRK
ncbi:MAG TPA: PEP-CTERM sorting domain-containing protein [Pyrinomonadaceae bacterium]|nr:PEP-CTERM sorting domain-containing protein [Pyrinomonadaceae bacterium]